MGEGKGWWSPVYVVRYAHWLSPRESEKIGDAARYRWRWLAHALNPIGHHLRTVMGRPCFIEFRVVSA